MGLTISDTNKIRYAKYRKAGLSHDEALDKWPDQYRERVEKDLELTFCESHFGMKLHWLIIIHAVIIISAIVIGYSLEN